ncbi:MAG: sulfite exporter TauE/SafE family protein [Oscillospiraceae bacterium]|nr:sulfite exporter TauE/SafE family protein [Oscillospiraceae bacterium]
MAVILFLLCLIASGLGAITGVGGGILIKPIADAMDLLPVSAISFLSGCTVLCMSASSLIRTRHNGVRLEKSITVPLAVGSVGGGLLGKYLFELIRQSFGNEAVLGLIQAALLLLMTLSVLVYYAFKEKIAPRKLGGFPLCLTVGLTLGVISSFLGIGGGPANVAILCLLFSMTSKEAAKNSIFIIFFSQVVSLISTVAGGTVPDVKLWLVALMAAGGVGGAIIGSSVSKKLSDKGVDKVFMWMLAAIALVNVWNIIRFAMAL